MRQLEFQKPAAIEIDSEFITDHNRSDIVVGNSRLVTDVRTQFGDLRRYYKADKKIFEVSWTMIPQNFEHTVDGNLGAEDMIEFFERKTGVCKLKIYYEFGEELEYNVVITEFSSTLRKRWDPYRFYDCSLTMEEV